MRKLKHVYSKCNQYALRDIEQLDDYYMVHIDAMTVEDLRSKSDIAAELAFRDKRIAEFEKENKLLKRVEKIFNDSPDLTFGCCERLFPEEFKAHNLEQKAKGANDFKEWVLDTDENSSGLDVMDISLIEFYVEPLIRQAKSLKEQVKP